jgi:hypothetical protein
MADEWPTPEEGSELQTVIDGEGADKTGISSHDGAGADEEADAIEGPSREGAEGDQTEFLPPGGAEAEGMGGSSEDEDAPQKLPNGAKSASPQVNEAKEVETQKRLEAGSERTHFSVSEEGASPREGGRKPCRTRTPAKRYREQPMQGAPGDPLPLLGKWV